MSDPLAFSKAGRARSVEDGETWVPGEVSPTLNAFDNGTESRATVVAVVQDGREIDKRQNGLGITDGAAPAYTLDQTGAQAVAVSQNQRGEVVETDYAHQLTTGGGKPGDGYAAARTGTVVRRLTPLECERLMGWSDDHTRWRADGTEVSDSARYRMCGNGVASPVAHYLAACINRALEQEATDAA